MVSTAVITVDIIVPGIAIIAIDVVYKENITLRAKWRTRSRERIICTMHLLGVSLNFLIRRAFVSPVVL